MDDVELVLVVDVARKHIMGKNENIHRRDSLSEVEVVDDVDEELEVPGEINFEKNENRHLKINYLRKSSRLKY